MRSHRLLLPAVAAVLVLPLLSGCDSHGPKRTNFSHLAFQAQPLVRDRRDPDVDFARYQTFAIAPITDTDDPLAVKQLARVVRQVMEILGYSYADDIARADVVLSIGIRNEYNTIEIPATQVPVSRYVPGRTVTSRGSWSGNVGAVPTYGTTGETITIPGRWTIDTYTLPPRRQGYYYPSVMLSLYDPARYREGDAASGLVWSCAAVGTCANSDIRVTGNVLLASILGKLPPGGAPQPARGSGWVGVFCFPASLDGNTLYPIVLLVPKGTPADKAGLRIEDIITELDGVSTANMPIRDFFERLAGSPGDTKHLVLRRLDKDIRVTLTLAPRPPGK